MSKYNNKKTQVDNVTFDSKAEAARYKVLRGLLQHGVIHDLRLQPSYELQPAFTDACGQRHRAIVYRADFAYVEGGREIVEDVKGVETAAFKLKHKLFLFRYSQVDFRLVR